MPLEPRVWEALGLGAFRHRLGGAGPSGKDPGSLDLEELFFWLDGFGDLALIFGDPERPALLIKPEMSTPLLFVPGCR